MVSVSGTKRVKRRKRIKTVTRKKSMTKRIIKSNLIREVEGVVGVRKRRNIVEKIVEKMVPKKVPKNDLEKTPKVHEKVSKAQGIIRNNGLNCYHSRSSGVIG